jgi:hypothetical protein
MYKKINNKTIKQMNTIIGYILCVLYLILMFGHITFHFLYNKK